MVRAFAEGPVGKAYPRLLLDTGSAYTLISQEILESIGCSPAVPKRTQRIITGSGYEIVPVVLAKKFHCLSEPTLTACSGWISWADLKLRSSSIPERY